MSMFKRPSQRISCPPPVRGDKPIPGTLIYDISTQKPTKQFIFHKGSVYKEADYIEALKKNHQNLGIPYIEPNLPRLTPYHEPLRIKEPEILYGDRIQVTLRVLKNGTARVKVNGAIAMMYDKYYHRGVQAPIRLSYRRISHMDLATLFLKRLKKVMLGK